MDDQLIGKRLRDYLIIDCIGKGGIAKVYKARHTDSDELRAIKVLRPEFTESSQLKARFYREGQILLGIRNRHLVRFHEFGTLGKQHMFIVMEYLDGVSLRGVLREKGWLSSPDALRITKQVALGLAAAHDRGVIHRDISPDNILLVKEDEEDVAKLIDFGLAKSVVSHDSAKITGTMEIVGKAEYCSPEQIEPSRSSDEAIDGRTDIYSLGVTLFETLTGERPFVSKTPQGFLAMHLRKKPRALKEANPLVDISSAVEELVQQMLEKDRRHRPSSAAELFKRITAVQHDEPALTPV